LRAALVDLNDAPAVLQQAELINRLLPTVTDEQLSVPRDEIRIALPETRLWAADDQILMQQQAMKDLEGLYAEFMGRKPPAEGFAASCRFYQANWFGFAGKTKEAEAAIVEAHELLLHASAPVSLGIRVPLNTLKFWDQPIPRGPSRSPVKTLGNQDTWTRRCEPITWSWLRK
jgi:hypothetical protein